MCKRQIQWTADSQFVDLERGADDSEIFLNVKKAGNFTLYASVNGCELKDSISIEVFEKQQQVKIVKDGGLCPGKSAKLQASNGFRNYSWNTGDSEKEITINTPGLYIVTATDYCGNSFYDSISVSYIDTSWNRNQQMIHPTICKGDTMVVAVPAAAKNVKWIPQEGGFYENDLLYLFPERTTTYLVSTDFSNTCITEQKFEVAVEMCPETISFPNAFTPNGDGLNDIFQPTIGKPLIYFSFSIYNRFGQKIFESNDPLIGWDGRFKGEPLNAGLYVWVCTYQFKGRAREVKRGNIALIR